MRGKGKKGPRQTPVKPRRDLSDVDIGTSSTSEGEQPPNFDSTDTSPRGGVTYDVPVREYSGEAAGRIQLNLSTKLVFEIVAMAVAVAAVLYTTKVIIGGLDSLDGKVGKIGEDVAEIESTTQQNVIRLDALGKSMDDIEQEVRGTKELITEIRVDNAQSGGNDPENED